MTTVPSKKVVDSAWGKDPRSLFSLVLLNPVTHLVLSIAFNAAAQVFFRLAAGRTGGELWLSLSVVGSQWLWFGIFAEIASLASWLYALRSIKLLIAYNLSGLLHVLVPLASWLFLHEQVPAGRWVGIFLVLAGVLVVGSPVVKVEERL